jgi:hypothetical protein
MFPLVLFRWPIVTKYMPPRQHLPTLSVTHYQLFFVKRSLAKALAWSPRSVARPKALWLDSFCMPKIGLSIKALNQSRLNFGSVRFIP